VHMSVLEALPGLDSDKAKALATALIDVGLGEDMGQGHLRLDPALAPFRVGLKWSDRLDGLACWLRIGGS